MRSRLVVSPRFVAVFVMVFGFGTHAFAQEKGKLGLTMGYPSSVGIVYHLTDKLAIRPELNIAQASTETTVPTVAGTSIGTTTVTSSTWAIGTGVSALFYLRQWDDLHLYVSPRWTYGHASSSGSGLTSGNDSSVNTWSLNGSVGAQYALGKRFGLFGEVGFGYQHSHETGAVTPIQVEINGHAVGTRTGAGVILYF
ncbi:MAG TPA: outer membrane beta-barrel protein [Vicinamibacterales bacterium]|nr:outer membrane beta-barrel protein [Vicinamibacterales bacterium]